MPPLATIAELLASFPALRGRPDLSALLAGAGEAVRNWTRRRRLERGPVDELVDGPGRQLLLLPEFPAENIIAVEIDGRPVTDWKLSARRRLFRASGWPRGVANIRVAYTAGHDPIPEDIRLAVILTAANLAKLMPPGTASEPGTMAAGPLRKLQIDGYVEEFAEGPGREEARVLAQDLAAAIPSVARALLAHHERPRA